MTVLLLGLTILGFFGSLQYLFPNTLWNDTSVFFRKNKTDYLNFSNRFRGKYCFFLGCTSLAFFFVSFFIKVGPNQDNIELILFIILTLYIVVNEFRLEMKWNKQSHAPRLIMNYFLIYHTLVVLALIPVLIIKIFPLIYLLIFLMLMGHFGIFFYLKQQKITF